MECGGSATALEWSAERDSIRTGSAAVAALHYDATDT